MTDFHLRPLCKATNPVQKDADFLQAVQNSGIILKIKGKQQGDNAGFPVLRGTFRPGRIHSPALRDGEILK